VTRQARQLAWTFPERADPIRFLIRDRDNNSGPVSMLRVTPAFGAVLMSLSTVIVAINAQLLRRVNL